MSSRLGCYPGDPHGLEPHLSHVSCCWDVGHTCSSTRRDGASVRGTWPSGDSDVSATEVGSDGPATVTANGHRDRLHLNQQPLLPTPKVNVTANGHNNRCCQRSQRPLIPLSSFNMCDSALFLNVKIVLTFISRSDCLDGHHQRSTAKLNGGRWSRSTLSGPV